MQIPRALLTSLLALNQSTTANPTPQATKVIDPTPTPVASPDFSRCIFPAVIEIGIDNPFTLTAISDTLPLESWPVLLRSPSAKTERSPYISRTRIAQPLFTLDRSFLNSTGYDGVSYPGRFVPKPNSNVLQRFLFGGSGETKPTFYAIQNCDANANRYTELKTGRDLIVRDFVEGARIVGKDPEEEFPGKSRKIHLRINVVLPG